MSSYLTFYFVPKKKEGQTTENEPLRMMSFSRNNDIYQLFYENLNVPFIGMDENKMNYLELKPEQIKNYVIDELKDDIAKAERRLNTYYKVCPPQDRHTTIEDILSCEEYIQEMKDTLSMVETILHMVSDTCSGYNDFEKVLVNVD